MAPVGMPAAHDAVSLAVSSSQAVFAHLPSNADLAEDAADKVETLTNTGVGIYSEALQLLGADGSPTRLTGCRHLGPVAFTLAGVMSQVPTLRPWEMAHYRWLLFWAGFPTCLEGTC